MNDMLLLPLFLCMGNLIGGSVYDPPPPYVPSAPAQGFCPAATESIPLNTKSPGWNVSYHEGPAQISTTSMDGHSVPQLRHTAYLGQNPPPAYSSQNIMGGYSGPNPSNIAYLGQNPPPAYSNQNIMYEHSGPNPSIAHPALYPANYNAYRLPHTQHHAQSSRPHPPNAGGRDGTSLIATAATGYLLGSLCGGKCCRCFPCCCCCFCDSSCSSCLSISSCGSCF